MGECGGKTPVEHGYIVQRRASSPIVWVNFWQPAVAGLLPTIGKLVWALCAGGNDDEGYGEVVLAALDEQGIWKTISGEVLSVFFWSPILEPDFSFVLGESEAEITQRLQAAQFDVIEMRACATPVCTRTQTQLPRRLELPDVTL